MQKWIQPKVALWVIFFFVVNLIGCGGGGGGSSDEAKLKKQLVSYNTAVDWVFEDFADLAETVDQLNVLLESDEVSRENMRNISKIVDRFGDDADAFVASIEAMDAAEAGIQEIVNAETGLDSILISTIVGGGLVIYGLYSFGKKMQDLSNEASEARKDMEDAIEDIGNEDKEADGIADYEDAKNDLEDIGYEATEEFNTKVVSDLILSPVNPTSTTGVIIKHVAGNKIQDKLKVISATKECEDGYDGPGCKIGLDETDEFDSAGTPDGDVVVVVADDDMARVVKEENLPADAFTEILIDPVPVENAVDDIISEDDDTEDDDGDTSGGDDTGGDDTSDDDTSDDDIEPYMEVSASVMEEDIDSITYSLAVAVAGVTGTTSVNLSIENGATSGSTKTITADSTVIWTVTVLSEDAFVTVRRNDTGETQSVKLPGKKINYDGTYVGSAVTTFEGEDCFCWDSVEGITVIVSGSTIRGDATGTISRNRINGYDNEYPELIYSGSIENNVMSGTWYDSADGCCSGTFSLTKQ